MTSSTTPKLSHVLMVIPMFFGAIAWHLYRIATFRPKFDKLSDTGTTVGSFFLVYLLSAMGRWVVLGGKPPVVFFLGLILNALFLWVIFKPRNRSSSLVVSLLGASAVLDLLGIALHLTGIYMVEPGHNPLYVLEFALSAVCAWKFFKEPESVRRCRVPTTAD